jgi:hypothetical protein
MSVQFSSNRFVHRVSLANAIKQGWGLGKGRRLSPFSICSVLHCASARAGVEGENTPAHTQGAGAPETANPPKARKTTESTVKRRGLYIQSVSANDCDSEGCEDA